MKHYQIIYTSVIGLYSVKLLQYRYAALPNHLNSCHFFYLVKFLQYFYETLSNHLNISHWCVFS